MRNEGSFFGKEVRIDVSLLFTFTWVEHEHQYKHEHEYDKTAEGDSKLYTLLLPISTYVNL